MITEENKDLDYWKKNAEEDYMQVPISVLRYIFELEEVVKNCSIPAVYGSIEEAVNNLKLDKRVKWKVLNNELCRYTKKSICPEYVVKNGMPVQINCR